jgi:hypothetical protein
MMKHSPQSNRYLYQLATRFYSAAESPSEEDMETVFLFLIHHDVTPLEDFLRSFGIELPTPQ